LNEGVTYLYVNFFTMGAKMKNSSTRAVFDRDNFQKLFDALKDMGYQTYGPTVRDNAIVYDTIDSVDALPQAMIDRQDNGQYRLVRNKRKALFDHVVGMHSWKKIFHVPDDVLYRIEKKPSDVEINPVEAVESKKALIGVRSCDLSALAIQDQILMDGPYPDPSYTARRRNTFIVAVNCGRPGGTCFCASMGTGPRATTGFDIALTELIKGDSHCFLVECGSVAGEELLKAIPHRTAETADIEQADAVMEKAAGKMGRKLNTDNLRENLMARFDSPYWSEIAQRCASCGNCTMVCPTCFCMNVEDDTDLSGQHIERRRKWDSCYTIGFSYIHGGSIRNSAMARYRQWLLHKMVYWPEQFGTFGCVGCGRCITWCPMGIDITEEATKLVETPV